MSNILSRYTSSQKPAVSKYCLSERDDFFITLHGDGFLLGQLFAESTETEAITLSGPELSELVGQTNFLHSGEQHSQGDSQSLPLGY